MQFISWRHALVDGLAVLVGILTAFGIQAYWDVRQEREAMVAQLGALATEVVEVQAGMRAHIEALRMQDDLIREILELATAPEGDVARLDTLVFGLGPFVPYEPALPALRGLEARGLGAVESDRLRAAVLAFAQALDNDLDEQSSYSEYWRGDVAPYWDDLFDIRQWLDLAPSEFLAIEPMPPDLPRLDMPVRHREILQDRRFLNQLSRRIIRSWRVKLFHHTVLDRAAALSEALAS